MDTPAGWSVLIVVTGDRHWTDAARIRAVLSDLVKEFGRIAVAHGGARGADTLAGEAALQLGQSVLRFLPDWGLYGGAAGPIRNRLMLEQRPALVVAFHDHLRGGSRGAKDCVLEAERRGIPVRIFTTTAGPFFAFQDAPE